MVPNIGKIAKQLEVSNIFVDTFDLLGKIIIGFVFIVQLCILYANDYLFLIVSTNLEGIVNLPIHIFVLFTIFLILVCLSFGYLLVVLVNEACSAIFSLIFYWRKFVNWCLLSIGRLPKFSKTTNLLKKWITKIYLWFPFGSYYSLRNPDVGDEFFQNTLIIKFQKYFELNAIPLSSLDGLIEALIIYKGLSFHKHVDQFRLSFISGSIGILSFLTIHLIINQDWFAVIFTIIGIYFLLNQRRRINEQINLDYLYRAYIFVLNENKKEEMNKKKTTT